VCNAILQCPFFVVRPACVAVRVAVCAAVCVVVRVAACVAV